MGARRWERRSDDHLPTFDSIAFAGWLRRWRDAEHVQWKALAERAGLSYGVIQTLAHGKPGRAAQARGQTHIDPSVTTLARIAYGLGLQFSYVAAKGGLGDEGERWENFTRAERVSIASALARSGNLALAPVLQELSDSLQAHHDQEEDA